MLRDQYEVDKLFEQVLPLVPEMDPALAKIDQYLEDETLFHLIRADLAQRRPKTTQTGRNSTPVEVGLRMLVVKRLYQYSYADTERHVKDSLVLRQFCRVYLNPVPDDTTLIRFARQIRPETLEQFNERIVQLAVKAKVTQGRKLRTDGTVVETNIHPPSDNRQLADGVRVLARTVERAHEVLGRAGRASAKGFHNWTEAAKTKSRQIGEVLRRRTDEAKAAGQHAYHELLDMTQQTVAQAQQVVELLQDRTDATAQRLTRTLQTFIPRVEHVIDQTQRRVMENEKVPAPEKLVSLFEAHTDILVRGKEHRPVEYGHKVWLDEVEGGLVSHYRILEGNPRDEAQWEPSLKAHLKTFGAPPHQASADRGVSSASNEQLAYDLGVKRVILPQAGHRSAQRRRLEKRQWFVKGRRWHAGVEGRISVLKRAHGLARCLNHGAEGFAAWVGWGIIAGNLAVLGRA